MLVGKDHAGGGRELVLQKDVFCAKKYVFCTERTPMCPFATQIAANYMSSHARPDPAHYFTHENSHVEIDPKFYVLFFCRASLSFVPQP